MSQEEIEKDAAGIFDFKYDSMVTNMFNDQWDFE